MVGEVWTKVPTARLGHASPQAVCRNTRLGQLSPSLPSPVPVTKVPEPAEGPLPPLRALAVPQRPGLSRPPKCHAPLDGASPFYRHSERSRKAKSKNPAHASHVIPGLTRNPARLFIYISYRHSPVPNGAEREFNLELALILEVEIW